MFASFQPYQLNAGQFQETDIFLASYPRSGNTWLRLLLSDLLLQSQGAVPESGKNVIPDVYKSDIATWYQNPLTSPFDRLIKTHEPYSPDYRRVIYIFRHPADCLASFYHYRTAVNQTKSKPALYPDAFYLTHIPQWIDHVESYLGQVVAQSVTQSATASPAIQFISYEALHSEPETVLQQIVEFIGLAVAPGAIQQAIGRQDFKKVKTRAMSDSETLGFWEEIPMADFFRQGQVGNGQTILPESVWQQIQTTALATYRRAQNQCNLGI